jgi:hypothetical protein
MTAGVLGRLGGIDGLRERQKRTGGCCLDRPPAGDSGFLETTSPGRCDRERAEQLEAAELRNRLARPACLTE